MTVGGKFAHNSLLRAAGTVSQGIAALDHEPVHDPVEGEAVIESFLYQLLKILDRHGSGFCIQCHSDRAVVLDIDPDMIHGRSVRLTCCLCLLLCLCLSYSSLSIAVTFLFALRGPGAAAAGQKRKAAEHRRHCGKRFHYFVTVFSSSHS